MHLLVNLQERLRELTREAQRIRDTRIRMFVQIRIADINTIEVTRTLVLVQTISEEQTTETILRLLGTTIRTEISTIGMDKCSKDSKCHRETIRHHSKIIHRVEALDLQLHSVIIRQIEEVRARQEALDRVVRHEA